MILSKHSLSRLVTVPAKQRATLGAAVFNYLLVIVLVVAFFWLSLSMAGIALNFDFVSQYSTRIWAGFWLTVRLSLASLGCSLLIGIVVAVGQDARILVLRYLCDFYVKIIRGTPLLAQIYLFFYIVGTAWGVSNRFVAGFVILSFFSGAYVAEIVRGSLLSIDAGQLEAARAVGFSRVQTVRHLLLPQLVSRTLPALTGQIATLIKDSSLLSVIAVIELTQTMREISSTNFNLFGCYLFLAVVYLCLTLPITAVSKWFEKRLNYAH